MCIRDRYKGNDGTQMRTIQTVEISKSDTTAQDSDTQSIKDSSEKKKNRKFPKKLGNGRLQGGSAINHEKLFKAKIGKNKKNTRFKKGDFCPEICVPVNKVFQPESTEPLFEVNTIQQSTPTVACPVEQELRGSVPTQSAWEDVVVISSDAQGLNEWLEEYCRTTNKNGYEILDTLF